MISWLQTNFQKHTKAFLVFLLVVITIPFVFTIGASPGIGRAGRQILEREFFGYNLGSEEDQRRLIGDAEISVLLQAGFPAMAGAQLQDYALQRAAAIALADQFRLPPPSQAQLSEHVGKMRLFHNEQGQFDPQRYAQFTDNLKTNPRLTAADVARVMADDVRIAAVQELAGGPGFVLDPEVASQLRRAGTEWTIEVATIDYAGFQPAVTPSDEELARYFEENGFRYEIPPRVVVDYVLFTPADHPTAMPTDAEIESFYAANPARFPTPEGAAPVQVDGGTSGGVPAAVRPAVAAAVRLEKASRNAARAASDFAFALFDQKIKRDAPELDRLLAIHRGTRRSAPPFTQQAGPAELRWSPAVVAEAFKLGEHRYFSDPLPLDDGSQVVLLWKETLPSVRPLLAEVRNTVLEDYRNAERRRRFVEAGRAWKEALAARIAAGESLATAVGALTGVPAPAVTSPAPFTLRQPPEGLDFTVLSALERIPVGAVSDLLATADKGLFVVVRQRLEPAIDPAGTEFAGVRRQVAQFSAGTASNLLFAEMVERELRRTEPPAP